MTFRLFDLPNDEPSRSVGYAGNNIDRRSELRADDAVETALADPRARIMLSRGGKVYLRAADTGFQAWNSASQAEQLGARTAHAVLLGWDDRGPVLAAPTSLDPDSVPDGIKAIDFRSVHVQGLLGAADLGALAQAAALLAWHSTHRFCSRCGAPSEPRAGGYKRVCTGCGTEHFPRTDPVAIMLAVTRDRCLMGRGAHFAPGMYSCLAGFIEPGETIEAAVRRETFEEAGIRIGRVSYHASQPWPFPYSLMIGCFGEALNEDIVPDPAELEDVRWFTRAEIRDMLSGTSTGVVVPPPMAIAHHIIKAWAESE